MAQLLARPSLVCTERRSTEYGEKENPVCCDIKKVELQRRRTPRSRLRPVWCDREEECGAGEENPTFQTTPSLV